MSSTVNANTLRNIKPMPMPIIGFASISLYTTIASAAWTIANPAILAYENVLAKNAVTVFGQTVSWEQFARQLELAAELKGFLEDGVSTAYLYQLFRFVDMNAEIERNVLNTRWRALFRYQTYRNYDKKGQRELLERLLGIPAWIDEHGQAFKIALSRTLYQMRSTS